MTKGGGASVSKSAIPVAQKRGPAAVPSRNAISLSAGRRGNSAPAAAGDVVAAVSADGLPWARGTRRHPTSATIHTTGALWRADHVARLVRLIRGDIKISPHTAMDIHSSVMKPGDLRNRTAMGAASRSSRVDAVSRRNGMVAA